MKSCAVLFLLGLCCCSSAYGEQTANPLNTVIQQLHDMVAKVQKDAEAESEAFIKFTGWCDETSMNGDHAVADAKKQKEKLEAEIQQDTSEIEVAHQKVEDLAASTAQAEAEKKKAKGERTEEVTTFELGEKELMEMIDALGRAVTILQKNGGAALAQVDATNMNSLVQALGTVLDAASFPSAGRSKLLGMVQSKASAEQDPEPEADAAVGAPNPEAYESKSGNIVEIMENMKEDAETQLTKLRQDEIKHKGEFELMIQSLTDRISDNAKQMAAQKGDESEASEDKAEDQGDLQATAKDLEASSKELKTVQHTCLASAADHDTTVAARKEELATLAKAIELLTKVAEGGAANKGAAFVQIESTIAASFSRSQVVPMVKRLAKEHHSAALAQLASRIAAAVRSGEDPFAKVRGMIKNMVVKLEDQATSEAKEKEYCDTEMKKATEKDESLEGNVEQMASTIDSSASDSAQLKERVKQDEADLGALSKEQAELDQLFAKQKEDYQTEKSDLEQALYGVRQALEVLKEYYGMGGEATGEDLQHMPAPEEPTLGPDSIPTTSLEARMAEELPMLGPDSIPTTTSLEARMAEEPTMLGADSLPPALLQEDSDDNSFMQQPAPPQKHTKDSGTAGSIIEIIELSESDFTQELAKVETTWSDAQSDYEKLTGENKVEQATKSEDVKFLAKRIKRLMTRMTENSEDKETLDAELGAVEEYLVKLKAQCIAKPESYEERAKRREAEVEGLKEALKILEEEEQATLLQRGRRSRRNLRAHPALLELASRQ